MAEKKHSAFALLNILKENTDKDHPLTTKEILSLLEMQYGLTLERRTVYANIDLLRQAGYELVSSELEQVPSVESTPDEKDLRKLKKLVDVLEDNDDVQNVHTNCAVDLEEIEL